MDNAELIGEQMASIVKRYVAAAEARFGETIAQLRAEVGRLTAELEAIPAGEKGERGEDGKDGTSVTVDDVRPMLAELVKQQVATLPKPKDGRDGIDGRNGLDVVGGFIQRDGHLILTKSNGDAVDFGLVVGRDGKDGADGRDGDPGSAGKDANLDLVRELVKEIAGQRKDVDLDRLKELLPAPMAGRDGKDGKDGKDADEAAIVEKLQVYIDERIAAIPTPKDGVDGRDGKDADEEAIIKRLQAVIEKKIADLPKPERGEKGEQGPKGEKGDTGVSIRDAASDDEGRVILTLSNGEIVKTNSLRGEDGLGFEDMSVEQTGDRNIRLKWQRGDRIKTHDIRFDTPIYRGVWDEAKTYEKDDVVTFGGAMWIAAKDTTDRPGNDETSGWVLSVKKGRDGKDGRPGEKGEKGEAGRPGRDLTQINPETGEKW